MTLLEEVRGLKAYLQACDENVIAANLDTAVIPVVERVAQALEVGEKLLGRTVQSLIAHEDRELLPWIGGVIEGQPNRAGEFLRSLAETALRADSENYPVLRPALVWLSKKYPAYHSPLWRPTSS